MRKYAKISPIRRARSITSYQDGLFKTLIEIGTSHAALAKKLLMRLANVGFSVERGETIAHNNFQLF